MRTVTLDVSSVEEVKQRALDAFGGKNQGSRLSFATPELLWKVLTAKRWALLKAMTGVGPMTLRRAARLANRDVKAVHADVHALLNAGILRKTSDGQIVFPFDAVRVNFMLKAA